MDTRINTRISEELKSDVTHVLNDCGLTISAAIRLFLEKVVQTQGLPFDVTRRPSAKTAAALREAQEIMKNRTARFDSMDAMLKELNSDGKQEK